MSCLQVLLAVIFPPLGGDYYTLFGGGRFSRSVGRTLRDPRSDWRINHFE